MQRPTPRLVLASASASRRTLLNAAGLQFDVRPADVDEAVVKRDARSRGLSVEDAALRLADLKAETVAGREPGAVVIGADQILACNGTWYDKPIGVAAAREQLLALRGLSHVLATAVVCREGSNRIWQHVSVPCMTMRTFSEDFLDHYLAIEAGTLMSTVGAYRIESFGVQLFAAVEGDHSAILGLPLLPLLSFLRQRGVLVS